MHRRPGSTHRERGAAPMHRRSALAGGLLLLALAGCSKVPGVYAVEGADSSAPAGQGGSHPGAAFDAEGYVAEIWTQKVVPTLTSSAHDADAVLAALRKDPAEAGRSLGRQAGTGSPFTYAVTGSGTVLAVESSSAGHTASVDLDPGDGTADLKIALGPAFLGTAVRDALPFIDFSQFTNQLDYADVATALNQRVSTEVVNDKDPASLKGRHLQFTGAFAALDPRSVIVTPVSLEVTP